MKYPQSLGEIEKQFPARYYSIVLHLVLHLQTLNKNIFRVYDSMGMLVHQAIVETGKQSPTNPPTDPPTDQLKVNQSWH